MSTNTDTTKTSDKTILLTEMQYIHIIDENSGEIRLVQGPTRVQLTSSEKIYGEIKNKIILKPNEYVVILNPKRSNSIAEGEKELRKGPIMFCLYPGELIEHDIQEAISIAENDGIYIHDLKTGNVRLEIGPKQIFLGAYEELYEKELSENEIIALNLPENHEPHKAIIIDLDDDTVIQLYDKEQTRIEIGPKRIFVGPFERSKIIKLSGKTPKKPDVITKSKIRLSPSFISDILRVRTKDNAVLELFVRYKQRFIIDHEKLSKLYLINDFVGFATETLASEIREEAAKHNFEEFHANTYDIIKDLLFPKVDGVRKWRVFENGLEIFSVDIKSISPEDPAIANKLNSAISNNMDIYVQKILQQAEFEAKKELIKGEKNLESLRKDLIDLKNSNERFEKIQRAQIEAKADIERESGKTSSDKIVLDAKMIAETNRVEKLKSVLLSEGSDNYLRLQELEAIKSLNKSYVLKSNSKIKVPYENHKE
jgi:regulator of protease activity HflC (stomatin/prohibitin superfamily)